MISSEIFHNAKIESCLTKSPKDCDKFWTSSCSRITCKSNECEQAATLRNKLEEALWEQGRIRGEAALLRQQLKEARNALSARELDLMRLRHDTKQTFECPGDSQCAESERLRAELSTRICEFESERERWLREKKQVLRYQRCLLQQLADTTEEQV
ncbi:NEDD4-binding protein 3-A-like isoform X2 [Ctenocephalides felis]|uniref:NEDD4-binding protein 3-A-like isoform X2 n=1 Tax=Ctenocephalides felis TaxID=7515 RepID=UPI000E6E33BD|nr:NEDD4-binding protein 3-A-like isoform X2 [Ctenocephalides felis]